MNKSYHYQEKNEIDLAVLIRSLWKERILILIFSISCMLLFYLYTLTFTEEFKTDVIIKDPFIQTFEKYDKSLIYKKNNNLTEDNNGKNNKIVSGIVLDYVNNFNLNLLSTDNLENFLQQSKEFDDFKVFLNKRNISAKKYFLGYRFGEFKEKDKKILNRYFIIFPKELEGAAFLNNYVVFIKNKTTDEFVNNLRISLSNLLTEYEQNFQIAKIVGFENPYIIKLNETQTNIIISEPKSYYFEGTKILSQKIIYIKELLSDLDKSKLDYNPILDKASVITKAKPFYYQLLYIFGGFVFGFFLSLIIIFFRDTIKNK